MKYDHTVRGILTLPWEIKGMALHREYTLSDGTDLITSSGRAGHFLYLSELLLHAPMTKGLWI